MTKAKKIGAIVSLAVIAVLIMLTIIMYNIRVDYGVNCKNPDTVWVKQNSNYIEVNENSDYDASKIVSLINKASKSRLLDALFNGGVDDHAEVITASTSSNLSQIPTQSTWQVIYHYDSPQTLMQGKKKFKDSKGNNYYYTELVFAIGSTKGKTEIKVYITPSVDNNGAPANTGSYSKYFNLTGDFTKLIDYLG